MVEGLIYFNRRTVEPVRCGLFERLIPGCFRWDDSLVCLQDHLPGLLLGSVADGTLRVEQTREGLRFEVDKNVQCYGVSFAGNFDDVEERGDVRLIRSVRIWEISLLSLDDGAYESRLTIDGLDPLKYSEKRFQNAIRPTT